MKNRKVKGKIRWRRMIPFYVMLLPGLCYLIMNNYLPMFGIVIAFKKLDFSKGIWGSRWNGLNNFKFLFGTSDAWVITRNTIMYNLVFIILEMILAIAIAILINEVRSKRAKTTYQSLILLPYLMSWVIVSYLAYVFLSPENGIFNTILKEMGKQGISWYTEPGFWPYILVFFQLWKTLGYQMIIYLASIVGISQEYYEAATIDGASKWQQITNITLPLIFPTVIVMFILSLGRIFRSDFGLFYQLPRNSGALYSVTRTLDVYIYNALMKNNDFGMSSAASFYQAVVGFVLVIAANGVIRKYSRENALF